MMLGITAIAAQDFDRVQIERVLSLAQVDEAAGSPQKRCVFVVGTSGRRRALYRCRPVGPPSLLVRDIGESRLVGTDADGNPVLRPRPTLESVDGDGRRTRVGRLGLEVWRALGGTIVCYPSDTSIVASWTYDDPVHDATRVASWTGRLLGRQPVDVSISPSKGQLSFLLSGEPLTFWRLDLTRPGENVQADRIAIPRTGPPASAAKIVHVADDDILLLQGEPIADPFGLIDESPLESKRPFRLVRIDFRKRTSRVVGRFRDVEGNPLLVGLGGDSCALVERKGIRFFRIGPDASRQGSPNHRDGEGRS